MLFVVQIEESVVRTLAVLTATDTAATDNIASAGLAPLLQLLKSPRTTQAALGNISLCLGNLAKQPSLLPTLRNTDVVASLLGMLRDCLLLEAIVG